MIRAEGYLGMLAAMSIYWWACSGWKRGIAAFVLVFLVAALFLNYWRNALVEQEIENGIQDRNQANEAATVR